VLGLRLQHLDGLVEEEKPVDFSQKLEDINGYLECNDRDLSVVVKKGGTVVRLADVDGRLGRQNLFVLLSGIWRERMMN
jgi:hypothetical protein